LVPFVAYLASDEAAEISGKVFLVAGSTIGVYSEPEISKSLVKYGGRWTMDEIRQQVPRGLLVKQ
jgi:hypothetical protein